MALPLSELSEDTACPLFLVSSTPGDPSPILVQGGFGAGHPCLLEAGSREALLAFWGREQTLTTAGKDLQR